MLAEACKFRGNVAPLGQAAAANENARRSVLEISKLRSHASTAAQGDAQICSIYGNLYHDVSAPISWKARLFAFRRISASASLPVTGCMVLLSSWLGRTGSSKPCSLGHVAQGDMYAFCVKLLEVTCVSSVHQMTSAMSPFLQGLHRQPNMFQILPVHII